MKKNSTYTSSFRYSMTLTMNSLNIWNSIPNRLYILHIKNEFHLKIYSQMVKWNIFPFFLFVRMSESSPCCLPLKQRKRFENYIKQSSIQISFDCRIMKILVSLCCWFFWCDDSKVNNLTRYKHVTNHKNMQQIFLYTNLLVLKNVFGYFDFMAHNNSHSKSDIQFYKLTGHKQKIENAFPARVPQCSDELRGEKRVPNFKSSWNIHDQNYFFLQKAEKRKEICSLQLFQPTQRSQISCW